MDPMRTDATDAAVALSYINETAPVLAIWLDAELCIVEANALAKKLLPGGAIGRNLDQIVVDFAASLDLRDLISRPNEVHMLTMKSAAGLPETYHFRFFPLVAGTLALGSLDFAEQQRMRNEVLELNRELSNLTRQLHLANAELRELHELKNQFLGMAAHDLRKPVGIIMTYSEFVLDEAGDTLSAEHHEFIRSCLKAAQGMKVLIDDFLDISVIESGHLRLNQIRLSVGEILEGVSEMGGVLARKKKVTLVLQPADRGLRVRVDAPKLQQVLLNLVGNAIEHSQPGQTIWLAIDQRAGELVFSVRDEGQGLSTEDQQALFKAFASGRTRKTGGERSTGLGLMIARKIVEAHCGRIWVESQSGAGATFSFSIPLEAEVRALQETRP